MMFTVQELELLDKVIYHYPQLKTILEAKLEPEQQALLYADASTMQVKQGRCQVLQDILKAMDPAVRPAKREVMQPFSQ